MRHLAKDCADRLRIEGRAIGSDALERQAPIDQVSVNK
jgi:hypothetical protein